MTDNHASRIRRITQAVLCFSVYCVLQTASAQECIPPKIDDAELATIKSDSDSVTQLMSSVEEAHCDASNHAPDICAHTLDDLSKELNKLNTRTKSLQEQFSCSAEQEKTLATRLEVEISDINNQVENLGQLSQDADARRAGLESTIASATSELQQLQQQRDDRIRALDELHRIGGELRDYAWVPFYGLHLLITYNNQGGDERAARLANEIERDNTTINEKNSLLSQTVETLTAIHNERGERESARTQMVNRLGQTYAVLSPLRSQSAISLTSLSSMVNYSQDLSLRLTEYQDAKDLGVVSIILDSNESEGMRQSQVLREVTQDLLLQLRGFHADRTQHCNELRQIPHDPATSLLTQTTDFVCGNL